MSDVTSKQARADIRDLTEAELKAVAGGGVLDDQVLDVSLTMGPAGPGVAPEALAFDGLLTQVPTVIFRGGSYGGGSYGGGSWGGN